MTQQGEDCYFFYNSSCSKGATCPFRHQEAALGKEQVCAAWLEGNCLDRACSSRHMTIQKMRSDVACFFETQPSGCRKANCTFRHVRREQLDESLDILPKLDLQAWTKPSVQFPLFLQKPIQTDTPSPKLEKIVINMQEESDQESMNGSPIKKPTPTEERGEPALHIIGRRSLLTAISSSEYQDEGGDNVREDERVDKTVETMLTEMEDPKVEKPVERSNGEKPVERTNVVLLKTSTVSHESTIISSNEAQHAVPAIDSSSPPDRGIDLGIKSLEQIQRQRAIESMKRYAEKREAESKALNLEPLSSSNATNVASPRKIAPREQLKADTPPPRQLGARHTTLDISPRRFKTKDTTMEVSPQRIFVRGDAKVIVSPRQFGARSTSREASPRRHASRVTSEDVSRRRVGDGNTSEEASPRRFAGRNRMNDVSPSRRIIFTRSNTPEDSDSDDRIDEPRRPVVVVTRPSAKARLGWNSPERTTRDNFISKNKHRVVPEFATRLGRDKDSGERDSSKDQDRITSRYEKKTSMQHSRTSPHSRPNKNSVKSSDVVRKCKSISSSESESEISSDQERIPSPLIPVSNRGRRLPDSRQNKTVTTDARLLITTKSSRVRRVEETRDEVVPAKRSVASTDYKKSPVRLVAKALPTRRIFIAEGSKTNDTGSKKSENSCTSDIAARSTETSDIDNILQIKSANVRRLKLERAKQTSSAPERMKLTASLTAPVVHIKPTGSAPERARLVTSSSSAPAVGIRTLADLKREKEEKLRRDKTESKNESSMWPRKRCHAGLELYKPPSVLRKASLEQSLNEKRREKHKNDSFLVNKPLPRVKIDEANSSATNEEVNWLNVRTYAELMADKKKQLKLSSSSISASDERRNLERRTTSSSNVLPVSRRHPIGDGCTPDSPPVSDDLTSNINTQSAGHRRTYSENRPSKFTPVMFDYHSIPSIRLPSRPFARKRLKGCGVKEKMSPELTSHRSEEGSKQKMNNGDRNVSTTNEAWKGISNGGNAMSMAVEECRGNAAGVGSSPDVLTTNNEGVVASQPRPRQLSGRRRTSRMSKSDTSVIGESENTSAQRLTSVDQDLLSDCDDIFSDGFLSDLTQYPVTSDGVGNVAIDDDDDDFLEEMKVLLS